MGAIFALRGDSLDARYSKSGKTPSIYRSSGLVDPAILIDNGAGIFGSRLIDFSNNTALKSLAFPARQNWSRNAALAVLMRIVPGWTGAPTASQGLFMKSADGFLKADHLEWFVTTAGRFQFFMTDRFGATILNAVSANVINFVAGTPIDMMISWDGLGGAGKFKISINGVELETITMAARTADPNAIGSISIGNSPNGARSNFKLNELVVFDNAEAHVYAARTDFYAVAALDGEAFTDLADTSVKHSTAYVAAGVAKTGNYRGADLWSTVPIDRVDTGYAYTADGVPLVGNSDDPNPADVKIGVVYDNGTKTGVYTGADRWSDPGVANVKQGIAYEANDVAKVGTLISVTNVLTQSELQAGGGGTPVAKITQSDVTTLVAKAMNGTTPHILTDAVLESYLVGHTSTRVIANGAHTITDAAQGLYSIALTADDTKELKLGERKIITKVTQFGKVVHFHGKVNVVSANPKKV